MTEQSTTPTTEATATPDTTPTAPVKPATFEQAKLERRQALAEPAAPEAPAETPAATPATETKKADVALSEEQLEAAASQSKEARTSKARLKELEAATEKYTKAAQLIAEGKHLAAIDALGIDFNAAITEQLGQPIDAETTESDAKTSELAAQLKALQDAEAKRAAKEASEIRSASLTSVVKHVADNATKYTFLARSADWVDAAYKAAEAKYEAAKTDLDEGQDLSADEKRALITAALDEAEANHKAVAKLYGANSVDNTLATPNSVQTSSKPSARQAVTFKTSMRGGTVVPQTPSNKRTTFEQAKAERRR